MDNRMFMCLFCFAGCQVMNEVALHRGRYPHLAVVDIFVDNQFLTESVVRRFLSL